MWVICFVAMATGDGLRVAAGAWVLFPAMGAFVEVANGAAGATDAFAMQALIVQEMAQLFHIIARNRGFIGGYRVVSVVVMAARRAMYAISQVNQFVRYRHFERLWLHIRFDKYDMAVGRFVL